MNPRTSITDTIREQATDGLDTDATDGVVSVSLDATEHATLTRPAFIDFDDYNDLRLA